MTNLSARVALCAAIAASLGGCAVVRPLMTHLVQIRPIPPSLAPNGRREDGYYASAKIAIDQRDYARALELLQAARAVNPNDARILNAFAVVYDKLSRFDLSARYYAEASALDPGSLILANNIAWSQALRERTAVAPSDPGVAQPGRLALGPAEPAAPTASVAAARPAIIRLSFSAPPTTPMLALTRRGIAVTNASGRTGGAAPVVQELARLGWTPRTEAPSARRTATSTITYPASRAPIARALAATLPSRIQLVDCDDCEGVRLTLGADSVKWSFAASDWKKGRAQ